MSRIYNINAKLEDKLDFCRVLAVLNLYGDLINMVTLCIQPLSNTRSAYN